MIIAYARSTLAQSPSSAPLLAREPARMSFRWLLMSLVAAGWLAAPAAAEEATELQLHGLTFVSSRADVNELIIEAEEVTYVPATDTAGLERVRVQFAGEDGEMSFKMVCDRGELNLESMDFRAEGNVRARTADGIEIRTAQASYERETGLVTGTSPVRITRPHGTLTGDGFEYHVDERRLRVRGTSRMVHGQ
jgi:LPS export ABC transporter protein LptC